MFVLHFASAIAEDIENVLKLLGKIVKGKATPMLS